MKRSTNHKNGAGTITLDAVGPVNNDGRGDVLMDAPYMVEVEITGAATLLFHRWSCEAVAEKAAAKKGSEQKKTDNVESYVYRNEDGVICLPGRYLVGSLTDKKNGAAKYMQDPRSPRKSALDLYKAGVTPIDELAPILTREGAPATAWDYLDHQRVTVNNSGVTRVRPAFLAGWKAVVTLQVLTPAYITPDKLHEALNNAGTLVGVGDFRPTYGRFRVTRFESMNLN